MSKDRNPQAKKRRSLLKDCRNTYGEHDKSSRTSIRWRKSWVNRTYRRDRKQVLAVTDRQFDELNDEVKAIVRHHWRKYPDMPLGKKLHRDRVNAIAADLLKSASIDTEYLAKLARYLSDRDLPAGQIASILRRTRALILDPNSCEFDLDLVDLEAIATFINIAE